LLSTLILKCTFLNLFLDYENTREEDSEESDDEKVYYEEPDLLGGVEGKDYCIVFGAEDKDIDGDA
jgi:hypothetical protein